MPNFNNCKVGINLKNSSSATFTSTIRIKDSVNAGVILDNNSILENVGISGSTGSSLKIENCERGIQMNGASRIIVENAQITDTRYGVLSLNASTFDFNKSVITAGKYSTTTDAAYGVFAADSSVGNVYTTSITGYPGGTASLTSGNLISIKSSKIFVGTTADKLSANTVAFGTALQGDVLVDVTLGTFNRGNWNVAYYPDDGLV